MRPAPREGCRALSAGNETETHPETSCSHSPFLFRLSPARPPRKKLVRLLREISWVYLPRLRPPPPWLPLQTGEAQQEEHEFIGCFPQPLLPQAAEGALCNPLRLPVPRKLLGVVEEGARQAVSPRAGFCQLEGIACRSASGRRGWGEAVPPILTLAAILSPPTPSAALPAPARLAQGAVIPSASAL